MKTNFAPGAEPLGTPDLHYQRLQQALAQAPALICVMRGPEHVIETANDRYLALIGNRAILGKPVRQAFPELDPGLLASIDRAYESGEPQHGTEVAVEMEFANGRATRYFDYVFQPLTDDAAAVTGVMTHAVDVTERKAAERAAAESRRRAELTAEVALALTRNSDLRNILQHCVEAVVDHLDAAFARVWTLDASGTVLELQASAGMYTHLDGPHSRVPVGQFKIGLIAQERQPHLTNDVLGDPRVGDQAWARREGMQAFAGYPLMIDDELVGVLAMFARQRLSEEHLQALSTVAYVIALGVRRRRADESLRARAEELAQLTSALARSNRELDAFAYAASHDLRAPLRGVANLAQWIEEDLAAAGQLRPDTREMLSLMRGRMHRMEALIEGILQYSRAGRIAHTVAPVAMRRLVEEVVDLLAVPEQGRIEVGDLPEMETAALPLQQIFMNLIGNALKHAGRPDPHIRIDARDAGDFYEFSVSDNGPGIPPEYHERIWGIFQTLEARDKVEGTGIGLSLVKKLVEGQGGRVWVESARGAGATFRFLWPRTLRAAAASAAVIPHETELEGSESVG